MSKFLLGKIVKAQGLKGEMKIYPLCDESFFDGISKIYLGENGQCVELQNLRMYNGMAYIKLDSVQDRDMAEKMIGMEVYTDRESLQMQEDEYISSELVGKIVLLDTGENMGQILEVQNYGSADILTISGKYGQWQIPFLQDLVIEINMQSGFVILSKKRFDEVKV